MSTKTETSEPKREALALAMARIERLGSNSPAASLVCDSGLFEFFSTEFLPRHELVTAIAEAVGPEEVTQALFPLADVDEDTLWQLARAGGVEAVAEAMRRHPADRSVTLHSLGALWRFAANPLCRAKMRGSTMALVVATLDRHKSDSMVAHKGAGTIANLVANIEENKRALVAAGGIGALLATMTAHPDVAQVAEQACRAFGHLFSTEQMLEAHATKLVRDAISAAAEAFPHSSRVRHCADAVSRKEAPEVVDARSKHVCTRVCASLCPTGCPAGNGYYCPRCSRVMRIWLCVTCFGTRTDVRICETCFERHHAGHDGTLSFRAGTCDCQATECKEPPK